MEDDALFQKTREGDDFARKVLIEKNLGLVRHVAKRFEGRGVEAEDLFQIGSIGLIKSVDKFDPSMGTRFSTYAVPVIMGEIRRFLRDDGPVKIPRSIRENAVRLEVLRADLRERLGRDPRVDELAEAAGMSREDVLVALESREAMMPLEGAGAWEEKDAVPLLDRIAWDAEGGSGRAVTNPGERDAEKEKALDRMLVRQMMERLDKEDQKLLWLRYFRDQTQTQTANALGISQVQVSRREKRILEALRKQRIS